MTERSDIAWLRSSYCEHNSCVEVAFLDDQIAVRDSKNHDGAVLHFTPTEWSAFLDRARGGEFEPAHRRAR
jgi:hypothetical protein